MSSVPLLFPVFIPDLSCLPLPAILPAMSNELHYTAVLHSRSAQREKREAVREKGLFLSRLTQRFSILLNAFILKGSTFDRKNDKLRSTNVLKTVFP